MRVRLVAVVAVLVVFGGCWGAFTSGQEYPPGVTSDGVENATELADAHMDELRDGYQVESNATYRAENGSVLQRVEFVTRWSASERVSAHRFEDEHPVFGTETRLYTNDSGTWLRIERPQGEVAVERGTRNDWRTPPAGPGEEWGPVYVMASAPETDVETFSNGTARISFEGARYENGNGTGTMTVTEDGLVQKYELAYDGTWNDSDARVRTVRTYSGIGEPNVTEPDWIENATADR